MYYVFGFGALAAVVGTVIAIVLWDEQMTHRRSTTIYVLCLLFLLPMSAINYSSGDVFIRRSVQAVINLCVAIVSAVVLMSVVGLRLRSDGLIVLRAFAVLVLVFSGIAQPIMYSLLWLLHREQTATRTASVDPNRISAAAAVAAVVVAFLIYKRTPS